LNRAKIKNSIKIITAKLFRHSIVWQGEPSSNAVYLTFDDGPRPGYTDVVLEQLAIHGTLATFFLLGEAAVRHRDIVKRIVSLGHGIGNHMFTHRPVSHLGLTTTFREIGKGERAISSLTGRTPRLIRPPYGKITMPLLLYIFMKKRKAVMWSWDSNDSFVLKDEDLLTGLDDIEAGDIVLFHDETAITVRNIALILKTLKKRGFRFALVDELLQG
jgi:peptidoglycan-N-acetylglucosamine deacetylase